MRRALLVVLAACALPVAPAGAATVSLSQDSGGPLLHIAAGEGETNVVEILASRGELSVTDPGAPLTAGDGCRGPSTGPVVCAADLDEASVRADLGDGDDRLTATLPTTVPLYALGGPGDDELNGGDGRDVLQGGPGDDVLDGDFGMDVADYSDHASAVTVNVASTAPAGSEGEHDTLSGIEGVYGGAGNDVLRAPSRDVSCGAGRDRLTPVGDSGLHASADCELLAFSHNLALEHAARRRGGHVRLVLRGHGGEAVRLRIRAGGRSFTRHVRLGYDGRRAVRVRVSAGSRAVRVTARGRTLSLPVTR